MGKELGGREKGRGECWRTEGGGEGGRGEGMEVMGSPNVMAWRHWELLFSLHGCCLWLL